MKIEKKSKNVHVINMNEKSNQYTTIIYQSNNIVSITVAFQTTFDGRDSLL